MQDLVLDHVGVAVSDLEAGRAAYERLGFTLTTRSAHAGRATGNHCAMFADGYVEIIGIVDPAVASSFPEMVGRYEGLHIVAFGCGDAEGAFPVLSARHPGLQPPELLERNAEFGPAGAETRRAAFRNIYADGERFPEAHFLFIEHLTPEVLWQPHLLSHPNGAVALAEIAICAPDVDATARRLATVLGVTPQAKGGDVRVLDLARGRIYVLGPAMVPRWAEGVQPPAVPSVVGFGVTVADLGRTKAYLDRKGVAYHPHPYPAIWLDPPFGRGAVISFIEGRTG